MHAAPPRSLRAAGLSCSGDSGRASGGATKCETLARVTRAWRASVEALRSLRGATCLALLLLAFVLLGGLYQRLVLWPLVSLWPRLRAPLMRGFAVSTSRLIVFGLRLGGAQVSLRGRVPGGAPVLVLMNHQSLLDVPLAYLICRSHLPLIVTRSRYGHGVPVVSLMLRILDYPLVDPVGDPRGAVGVLRRAVERWNDALLLFPEGHRTHDGELDTFETAGIRVLLGARRVPVYLLVGDGWHLLRALPGALARVHRLRGTLDVLGPFEAPAGGGRDLIAFVERLEGEMRRHLETLRAPQS